MVTDLFHPAVRNWFNARYPAPTPAQVEAWPVIRNGSHVLLAAPTGSGKTLAAFLAAIDTLVREAASGPLPDATQVLYVSPLRALSNDIQKNLQEPLNGIADELNALGIAAHGIRAQVRTGDTTPQERTRMRREPPHILVTTPESLFILLTSDSGRRMLSTVRSVIVDEIHAVAESKRGAHLCLSLERLELLTAQPTVRIGLSATQRPMQTLAQFLTGDRETGCAVIDTGHVRRRDLALELPGSPLEAVMPAEVWSEVYDRLAELIRAHRTTLVFVNTRRLAERAARHLAERLGEEVVTAHHGSLAREHRLDAEQRLKGGRLRALVATASLELGIDIGDVDLVCQIGSPRSISALLQRVGRSGHQVTGLPKGRLFPLSRDELVESAALLDAVQRGELDLLRIRPGHLDVLAQQIVAEISCGERDENELYDALRRAWPYRELTRQAFDAVVNMLAEGYSTRRGRRSRYLHVDAVNHRLKPRPGARITAVTNAGAIPDLFDYDVVLEPAGQPIGSVNEDFAFESLPGDIFQLGNTSYRILKVEQGKVRVEDAHGQPPNIPFWFGEAPGRTDELSAAVSRLRAQAQSFLAQGADAARQWLENDLALAPEAAGQIAEYLAAAHAALGRLPTQDDVIFERFFDEAGDQHLVIHSPYGSRVNRAWGLALRKRFCRKFNFELQAAALEDSIVISLGATHSFPLEDVTRYLRSDGVREIVIQAMLAAPMFPTHWRWNASIALAIRRQHNGRRVPAQFQRMDAEDLMAVVFPDQLACQDNLRGEREVPDHPLVAQTVEDCLHEVMDISGLRTLLQNVEQGRTHIHCVDLSGPSPLAHEILGARPYAFLDDAPAEERRTQAVFARRFTDPEDASELGRLDPEAIAQVRREAWPQARNVEEMHDVLLMLGFLTHGELERELPAWQSWLGELAAQRRATIMHVDGRRYHVCAERLPQMQALFADARLEPPVEAAGAHAHMDWSRESALIELLRARLECTGPVTESALAALLEIPLSAAQAALAALENEGYAMRGRFTQAGDPETEWCERALLARIHRYTIQSLRQAVRPVSADQYMRFLLAWQGLGDQRAQGADALMTVLDALEGFAVPAAAWESDILPARLEDYQSTMLDGLCGTGRVTWYRPAATRAARSEAAAKSNLLRNTPIMLADRASLPYWPAPPAPAEGLSATARRVMEILGERGACFFIDIVRWGGLLRTQAEDALAELAANGIVTSDSFAGLRALITPAGKRPGFGRRMRRRAAARGIDDAGRWSLLQGAAPESEPVPRASWMRTDPDALAHIAQVLLRRYGVVFRKVLERESLAPPWRELLYVYRRMEARGEVRGGRFVDGFAGEQFAAPEAVALLRRDSDPDALVALSSTDPLNLAGIILPGEKVPVSIHNRIVLRNGTPVAVQTGSQIAFLAGEAEPAQWRVRNLLARRRDPAAYLAPPPRSV